jgi:membrane protein YdbS with pleckstrin-like domain
VTLTGYGDQWGDAMDSRRDKLIGYSAVVLVGVLAAELLRYMAFHGTGHVVIVASAIVVVLVMVGATVMVARR